MSLSLIPSQDRTWLEGWAVKISVWKRTGEGVIERPVLSILFDLSDLSDLSELSDLFDLSDLSDPSDPFCFLFYVGNGKELCVTKISPLMITLFSKAYWI